MSENTLKINKKSIKRSFHETQEQVDLDYLLGNDTKRGTLKVKRSKKDRGDECIVRSKSLNVMH